MKCVKPGKSPGLSRKRKRKERKMEKTESFKILRTVYACSDSDQDIIVDIKSSPEEAAKMAEEDFRNSMKSAMRDDSFEIPAQYVDKDGYVEYDETKEFSSSECGWSTFDGTDWCEWGSIIHDVKIELTPAEIEAVYRFRERQYRIMDAKRQLIIYVTGCDDVEPSEREKDDFLKEYGREFEDVLNDQDCLSDIVYNYEDRFDCNVSENDTWADAVAVMLDDMKEEMEGTKG